MNDWLMRLARHLARDPDGMDAFVFGLAVSLGIGVIVALWLTGN